MANTLKICPICKQEFEAKPREKYCVNCKQKAKLQGIDKWKKIRRDERLGVKPYQKSNKSLKEKLDYAIVNRTTYAEMQKMETLKMYGKIEL